MPLLVIISLRGVEAPAVREPSDEVGAKRRPRYRGAVSHFAIPAPAAPQAPTGVPRGVSPRTAFIIIVASHRTPHSPGSSRRRAPLHFPVRNRYSLLWRRKCRRVPETKWRERPPERSAGGGGVGVGRSSHTILLGQQPPSACPPAYLWYNLPPQSVVPFALDPERKGLNHESIAH